jgi:hypothetical protein
VRRGYEAELQQQASAFEAERRQQASAFEAERRQLEARVAAAAAERGGGARAGIAAPRVASTPGGSTFIIQPTAGTHPHITLTSPAQHTAAPCVGIEQGGLRSQRAGLRLRFVSRVPIAPLRWRVAGCERATRPPVSWVALGSNFPASVRAHPHRFDAPIR